MVGRWGARFRGRRFPCAVGRGGIGEKRAEGDGITPVGRHRIEAVLRRPDRVSVAHGKRMESVWVLREALSGRATAGRTIRPIPTTTGRCAGRTASGTRRCGGRIRCTTWSRSLDWNRHPPVQGAGQRDLPARLARAAAADGGVHRVPAGGSGVDPGTVDAAGPGGGAGIDANGRVVRGVARAAPPRLALPAMSRASSGFACSGSSAPSQAAREAEPSARFSRAARSLTDITCAVEAARITRVARCTSSLGIGPKPRSG